jgi:hypothetical protein
MVRLRRRSQTARAEVHGQILNVSIAGRFCDFVLFEINAEVLVHDAIALEGWDIAHAGITFDAVCFRP